MYLDIIYCDEAVYRAIIIQMLQRIKEKVSVPRSCMLRPSADDLIPWYTSGFE